MGLLGLDSIHSAATRGMEVSCRLRTSKHELKPTNSNVLVHRISLTPCLIWGW